MADAGPTYPSKVDWWIAGFLLYAALAGVVMIVAGIVILALPTKASAAGDGGAAAGGLVSVFGAAMLGMLRLLVWPVRYELGPTRLHVRAGATCSSITYERIVRVTPVRTWLKAPALSLDRLRIDYEGAWPRFVVISPADKQSFLRDLAARAPHLVPDELTLRRPEAPTEPQ